MKIPKAILREWKLKRKQGDGKEISTKSGISENTISNALRTGQMSEKTFDAISEYYKDKQPLSEVLKTKALGA